ncbi:hypothetical protein [Ideonella sp. A 288]|uniref:hypothetical protein n=1 Tax=Ideonella sp. A 288 TaxID=1962181 RepID=UPI00130349C8|nr:hypothetical protein [Ideonella sp. A 288]
MTVALTLDALTVNGLQAGALARLRVVLTSSEDGSPLPRVLPGVWFDVLDGSDAAAEDLSTCQRRIARYARGTGINPQALLDLNGYDVLTLNADASISVLDPRTQFAGKTSLKASLPLPGPGFDWATSADDRLLWVSVPAANAVSVSDLAQMRTLQTVALAGRPGRVRVEPGSERAWVGVAQADKASDPGGMAVIDPVPPFRQHWLPLGRGHAEVAFDPAGWAAVTQRDAADVVFIDRSTLKVVRRQTVPMRGQAPPQLLGVLFDDLSRRFVVVEAREGNLWSFDHRGEPVGSMPLKPGIGPMALTPDGRWLLVANPSAHKVDVIDLPAWRHAQTVPVSGRPFQIGATSSYAYIRALDSEAVSLIAIPSLSGTPRVQSIAMGERPPGRSANLPLAAQLAPMIDGSGSFVASPGDNAVYFYMEGMNAAAGSVSARGHELRAVRVARRGLREGAPGTYEMQVDLPAANRLVVAVATDAPRMRQCASVTLAPASPLAAPEWQLAWDGFPVTGTTLALRIEGTPERSLPGAVQVRLFQPGSAGLDVVAHARGQGRYQAELPDLAEGLWYVHPKPPDGSGAQWAYASFVRSAARR